MLLAFIKQAKLRAEIEEILIPGKTRWRSYEQRRDGIKLDIASVDALNELADHVNVPTPW